MARDYRKEYINYDSKPKRVKARVARNKARRRLMALGAVSKGDGKDIDHRDKNPRNNSRKNLRIRSKSYNRSHNYA